MTAGPGTQAVPSSFPDGQPTDLADGWALGNLADAGFDAQALRRLVHAADTPKANLHSIVLERRGQLVAEFYFTGPDKPLGAWWQRKTRFGPEVPHDLRSISKSVVGLLLGIAQAEGKIGALNTPVLKFFPQYDDPAAPQRRLITLEHLLTMTAGLAWSESAPATSLRNSETRMSWARQPERYVLERPVAAMPGSRFHYNSGTTVLLAGILAQATGMPLEAYAREVLFTPLGITDAAWQKDRKGRALASAGLRMRPRDLAKIGRLLLDGGRWQERQVVPQDWVQAALQPHVATGDGLQYGYQWWVSATTGSSSSHPWQAALGLGGQCLFVVPSLDLSAVFTGGGYQQSNSRRSATDLFRRIIATAQP